MISLRELKNFFLKIYSAFMPFLPHLLLLLFLCELLGIYPIPIAGCYFVGLCLFAPSMPRRPDESIESYSWRQSILIASVMIFFLLPPRFFEAFYLGWIEFRSLIEIIIE